MIKYPKVLCLSGGGPKGLAHLGFLLKCQRHGYLDYLEKYIGTSIGSFICLLLLIGYDILEIIEVGLQLHLIMKPSLTDILKDFGLISPKDNNLTKVLTQLVEKKFGYIPTLQSLYKITGKHFVSVTCKLSSDSFGKECYLDHLSYPDLSCVDAVIMSFSIPILFHRFEYMKEYYIDGGIIDNFPISFFDNGHTPILGINLKGYTSNSGFFSYLYQLVSLPITRLTDHQVSKVSSLCTIINITTPEISLFSSDNLSDRFDLILLGWKSASSFIDSLDLTNSHLNNSHLNIPVNNPLLFDSDLSPFEISVSSLFDSPLFHNICSLIDSHPASVKKILLQKRFSYARSLLSFSLSFSDKKELYNHGFTYCADISIFHWMNKLFNKVLLDSFVIKFFSHSSSPPLIPDISDSQ